jgi:hypothetical protein
VTENRRTPDAVEVEGTELAAALERRNPASFSDCLRSPRRVLALTLALPLLFVGLLSIIYPVLDMLPFPGSSHEAFFEWWIIGIPLTWVGVRALRYAVRGSLRRAGRAARQ